MPTPQVFTTLIQGIKESAYGTATTPTTAAVSWIPHYVDSPAFQPRALRHILDEGFRGVAGQDFDLIPGPGNGTVSFNGDVYLDAFPHILQNMMGTDTTSGSTIHTMTAATNPPSYSYFWSQGVQSYTFPGTRLTSIRLSFNSADGAMTYSAQGTSKLGVATGAGGANAAWTLGATGANTGTPSNIYPASPALGLAGWQGAMTIAGVGMGQVGTNASVMEGEITFSRQLTPIHSLTGTQDISQIYAGPLQVQARLTMDWFDSSIYNYFALGTSGVGANTNTIVLTFTQGALSMAITITKAAWRQVDIERSGAIYTQVGNVTGLYSSADSGPCKVVVTNAVTTAY
jgi:Phage tail tube protein